jgi:hypothetical protein
MTEPCFKEQQTRLNQTWFIFHCESGKIINAWWIMPRIDSSALWTTIPKHIQHRWHKNKNSTKIYGSIANNVGRDDAQKTLLRLYIVKLSDGRKEPLTEIGLFRICATWPLDNDICCIATSFHTVFNGLLLYQLGQKSTNKCITCHERKASITICWETSKLTRQ